MFERGSEWRKWDLHIHTPNTKLNDNFKNDWDGFLDKIANSDIEVFGITDYFSFDNFNKLCDKIKELKTNNEILYNKLSKKVFLINIELRLEITDHNNKNVNLHIIFNNKMKNRNDQITKFFTRLKKNSQNGSFFDSNINYNTDFTTIEDIKKALSDSNINKKDYLIVGQMNGYGSCRECSDKESRKSKSLKNVRDFCDLFFGKEDNNKYTVEYYKKPTLFCSDAHSIDDLCIYNEEKIKGYTWIKADPTFDGLKQILYEYNDRIKIQELKPDEKSDFNLIDSIIILNKETMLIIY